VPTARYPKRTETSNISYTSRLPADPTLLTSLPDALPTGTSCSDHFYLEHLARSLAKSSAGLTLMPRDLEVAQPSLALPNYKSAMSSTSGPSKLPPEQCAIRLPKRSACLFDDAPSPPSTAVRTYNSVHHLRTKYRSQSLRSYPSSYASRDDRTVSTTFSGSRVVDRRPESQASSATSCCGSPSDSPDWFDASTSSTPYNEIWRSVTPKPEIWDLADLQSNDRPELSAAFTYLDFAGWSHRQKAVPPSPLLRDVRDVTRRHLIHGDELCPLRASFRLVEHHGGTDSFGDPITRNTDEKLAMQTDSLYLCRSELPVLQTAVDTRSSNVESPTPSTHSDERRHTIGLFYPSSTAGRGQAGLLFRAIAAEAKPLKLRQRLNLARLLRATVSTPTSTQHAVLTPRKLTRRSSAVSSMPTCVMIHQGGLSM